MEYSVKNIEKILIADRLNIETRNRYHYLETIDDIKKALSLPEYSQAVEAYRNGHIIYRGHKQQEDWLGAIVTPGIRKSKQNHNVYTKLLSEILPSWKEYPKRNKAVICTNNYDYAKRYSKIYPFIVFPQNNTKIGVCSDYDIWYSFPKLQQVYHSSLNGICFHLTNYMAIILDTTESYVENLFLYSDNEPLLERIREVNIKSRQLYKRYKNGEISNPFENKHKMLQFLFDRIQTTNLITLLDETLMNPEDNDFQLTTIDTIPSGDKELWFEGQHLMIRSDIGRKILNKA